MEKTVVELFAGVGGFRVGLNRIECFNSDGKAIENGDWKFVWANQWEPSTKAQDAFECYKKRFGLNEISNESIANVKNKDVPNHALLVGGFPCQDYSVARSLSGGKGIEGQKGVLFWEISRVLKSKKTPFVLLENVDRLLKSPAKQRGRDFGIMLRVFHDLGYNVEWRVINAAEYGCAQRRRRVYIFAWLKNTSYNKSINKRAVKQFIFDNGLFARTFPLSRELSDNFDRCGKISIQKKVFKDTVEMTEDFHMLFQNSGVMFNGTVHTLKTAAIKPKKYITLRDILDNETPKKSYYLTKEQIAKFKGLRGSKRTKRTDPNGNTYYYSEGSMSAYDSLDLPGRTMLTSESGINRSTHVIKDALTNRKRFITPIEAERLQDFPDNWTNTGMSEKRRYFMMGNALVTTIISTIGTVLAGIIENE